MTNELAIKIFKRLIKHGFSYDDGYGQEELTNDEQEACKSAIKALEQVKQIKEIINAPVYIQENVFRYQMICEVIRDDKA